MGSGFSWVEEKFSWNILSKNMDAGRFWTHAPPAFHSADVFKMYLSLARGLRGNPVKIIFLYVIDTYHIVKLVM